MAVVLGLLFYWRVLNGPLLAGLYVMFVDVDFARLVFHYATNKRCVFYDQLINHYKYMQLDHYSLTVCETIH